MTDINIIRIILKFLNINGIFAPDFEREKNYSFMIQKFNDGRWSRRIDVADFVYSNITP